MPTGRAVSSIQELHAYRGCHVHVAAAARERHACDSTVRPSLCMKRLKVGWDVVGRGGGSTGVKHRLVGGVVVAAFRVADLVVGIVSRAA